MPLRDHALLVVKWLAMDGVRLVGAHPPEIKDRYVDIKPQDWTNMFKLVNEADSKKMAKRAELAASKHDQLQLKQPLIHPDCLLMPDFHIEVTSSKNQMRTNAVFDVRGDAVIIGDVMLGLCWLEEPATAMLSVTRKKLVDTKWFEHQDAAANHYDVPSVPNDHWTQIVDVGRWETTESLHNKCYRAVGFVRIGLGADSEEPDFEDPFFLVMHEVAEDADATTPSMAADCDVFFVPRHESGQSSLLVSDQPTAHAVNAFRAFAAGHSRWMQVCTCKRLCAPLHLQLSSDLEVMCAIM